MKQSVALVLDQRWRLRDEGDCSLLYKASDFGSIERYHFVGLSVTDILALLDGQRSIEDAIDECLQQNELLPDPLQQATSRRLRAPLSLIYLPFQRCSKNCIYCYLKKAEEATQILPIARVKDIISEASNLGGASIALSGGVPFPREDSWDILEHAVETGMIVLLCTKVPLSEDVLARLAELGVRLQIGMDSFNPDITDILAGSSSSVTEILSCAHLYMEKGGKLSVKVAVTSQNVQDVPILIDMLADVGIQQINLSPLCWARDNDNTRLLPSYRTLGQLGTMIRSIRLRYRNCYVSMGKAIISCAHCSAEADTLIINAEGKAIACPGPTDQGREPVVGDMAIQGIAEVWNSDAFRKALVPSRDRFLGLLC